MYIGKITSNLIFHGILVFGYRGIVLYNTKSRLCSVNANSSSVHLRHFLSKKGVFLRPKTGFFASKPSKPYSYLTIALHPYNNICRHICHCVSCDGSVSSESSVQYKHGKAVWAVYEAVLTSCLMIFSFLLAQNFWLDRLWCIHLYPHAKVWNNL